MELDQISPVSILFRSVFITVFIRELITNLVNNSFFQCAYHNLTDQLRDH